MQTWPILPQQQLADILEWHPCGLKFAWKITAGPKASPKHHPWWQNWKGGTSEHPLNKRVAAQRIEDAAVFAFLGTKVLGLLVYEEPCTLGQTCFLLAKNQVFDMRQP